MKLIHYSSEPLADGLYSVDPAGDISKFKPLGLWVSVVGDDDWRSWCEGEQFGLDRLVHETEIVIKPKARILRLCDAGMLDDFTRVYSRPDAEHRICAIDWAKVGVDWQGIIIAPYRWDRRFEHMWYYGWDCASGCIWDAANAAEIVK